MGLPDGRLIRCRGLRNPTPDGPDPHYGIYLLGKRPPPVAWESYWVPWPDFWLPRDQISAIATLREVYERARSERVEIACGGGIGRTGTAIAAIAVIAGIPREDAISWARSNYTRRAVETPWQRRWIRALDLPDPAPGLLELGPASSGDQATTRTGHVEPRN